jgi:hypothetical protein
MSTNCGGIVFASGGCNMKVDDNSCYCTVLYSVVTVDNRPHVDVGFFFTQNDSITISSLANLVQSIICRMDKISRHLHWCLKRRKTQPRMSKFEFKGHVQKLKVTENVTDFCHLGATHQIKVTFMK